MDGAAEITAASHANSHAKSLGRILCLKCLGQAPAKYRMRVSISNKMQVKHIVFYPDVSDVGIPNMIGVLGHKSQSQVWILEIKMIGVRRVSRFLLWQHQMAPPKKFQEGITAADKFTPKFLCKKNMQLYSAQARSLHAVPLHVLDEYFHTLNLSIKHFALLVVPLPTLVKQSAKGLHALAWILFTKRIYCLTPSFFNIEMPSSRSAISMTFSRARQRMRSTWRLRSKSDMRS